MQGGYCSDVSYLEKVREKGQHHAKLEEALRLYGYNVTSLTYIFGSTGSQYHNCNINHCDIMRMLGIEHSVAKKLRDKIHEHTIACADKLLNLGECQKGLVLDKIGRGLGLTLHRSMTKVTSH